MKRILSLTVLACAACQAARLERERAEARRAQHRAEQISKEAVQRALQFNPAVRPPPPRVLERNVAVARERTPKHLTPDNDDVHDPETFPGWKPFSGGPNL
jgi:hypothetical protein